MADPDAVRSRAEALIELHLPGKGWRFGFDRARRRGGLCVYAERRIQLSRILAQAWSDEQCEQVVLHEIAHALAGPEAAHGRRWRAEAARIGCRRERFTDGGVSEREAPIHGVCPNGHEFFRYRMPAGTRSCSRCHRGFDPRFAIVWTRRD